MNGGGTIAKTEDACVQWLNTHLIKCSPPLLICDLAEDNICNGVAIGLLLEVLADPNTISLSFFWYNLNLNFLCEILFSGVKMDGLLLQPITMVERLHNIHELFAVLRRLDVKLDNIQPEDIMGGKKGSILKLITTLSTYFNSNTRSRRMMGSHESDLKIDSSGRTSAWSMGSSSRRTPSRRTPSDHVSPKPRAFPSIPKGEHNIDLWTNSTSEPNQDFLTMHPQNSIIESSDLDRSDVPNPRSRSAVTLMFGNQQSSGHSSKSSTLGKGDSPTFQTTSPRTVQHLSRLRGPYQATSSTVKQPNYTYSGRMSHPAESAQVFGSIDEIAQLRSQLNKLSKLIETNGADVIRSVVHSQYDEPINKCTQTELGFLLDRHSERINSEITELRRFLKIKEETLKRLEVENTRLNKFIKSVEESLYEQGISLPDFISPPKQPVEDYKLQVKSNSTLSQFEPYQLQPEYYCPFESKASTRVPSHERCSSFSGRKSTSPDRRGSPHFKRYPYYQPYIHQLTHQQWATPQTQPRTSSRSSSYNRLGDNSTTLAYGLTAAEAQTVKSPTQRLLMQYY